MFNDAEFDKRLREVVREEISRALNLMDMVSADYDGYETGELEQSARRAISKVAESVAEQVTSVYHGAWCDAEYGGTCVHNCETNWIAGKDN